MKKTLVYVLACVIILTASSAIYKQNIELTFKEIDFGICKTEHVYDIKSKKSPTGQQSFTDKFTLIKQTDKIPAIIGQNFGVQYRIESNVTKDILVEQVWIFPKEMIDDNGKKFKEIRYMIKKPTNLTTYSTYCLEKDYEVVKGTWVFQMFYKGEKLHERTFYVE